MADILIAGAGIAGSMLALLLGRQGLSVELFERGVFPKEKPCGEGLMPSGVAVLQRHGLAEAVGGAPFVGVRYYDGALLAEGRFPRVAGLPSEGRGQRRWHLDRALFEAAAATPGVQAHTATAVEAPIVQGGRVVGLVVGGQPCYAPLIVAADGLRSPLRRQLGLEMPSPARRRVGVRLHYRLAADQTQPPWVEVLMGRGYELYLTPLPERQLLISGLADVRDVGQAAATMRAWIDDQPMLRARLAGAEQLTAPMGRSPLMARARAGVLPGCVLLGDAAGFVDALTGGGMSQALLSAELLAGWLATHRLGDDDAWLVRFDRQRRALLRDYRVMAYVVLELARHHTLARIALRLLGHTRPLFEHLLAASVGMRHLSGAPLALRPVVKGR
jgi:flavin-dependent dehydrogenase